MLEARSKTGEIDIFYGDESRVCEEGYVPYGWQFKDENVTIPCRRGKAMNYFGLLSRDNRLHYSATAENIDAEFIIKELELFSMGLQKPTVVVLDNASAHKAKKVIERIPFWQERGLYIFYLPPYSPHLNIIERLWKELKGKWLRPEDYLTPDTLFFAVSLALNAVGRDLRINF